ncbi:MAG: hypothetical protein ABFS18_06335 [Thermodesulfobacteriota bacterium]
MPVKKDLFTGVGGLMIWGQGGIVFWWLKMGLVLDSLAVTRYFSGLFKVVWSTDYRCDRFGWNCVLASWRHIILTVGEG